MKKPVLIRKQDNRLFIRFNYVFIAWSKIKDSKVIR